MATNSYIGIINNDGSVDYAYCHNDGYPSHHAPILLEHYNSAEKARELINLGALSVLADKIKPSTTSHSFDNREENVVVAYHRDRGEDWKTNAPSHAETVNDAISNMFAHYVYLYDCRINEWIDGRSGKILKDMGLDY